MGKKSSWVPRARATTALLLLVGSGCLKDFDALSAGYGSGGEGGAASGSAGKAGSSGGGKGGSSASGGGNAGEAGVGAASGEAGEGGEPSLGGSPGTGGGENAQGGGCHGGLTSCPDIEQCIDLMLGTPDGNSSVTNCGECGKTCLLTNASSAACTAGVCAPSCQTGFGDCDSTTTNDGCETAITTPANCGACQYACSASGVTTRKCEAGHCTPICAPYYGDCNSGSVLAQDDGCERYLDALNLCTPGCGTPGVACDGTKVCNAGVCGAAAGLVVLSTPAPATGGGGGGGGGDNVVVASRYADVFPGNPDLDGSTVTVRLYAPGATNGKLWVYLSDSAAASGSTTPVQTDLSVLSQNWTDITVQAIAQGNFNPKSVKQVTIEVHFDTGPGLDPTIIYVDSVRSSIPTINDTFDSTFGSFVKSGLLLIPGSTLTWSAALPP